LGIAGLVFALFVSAIKSQWERPNAEVIKALVPVILLIGGIALVLTLVEFIAECRMIEYARHG
jgi:hypothetical protein